MAKRDIKHLTVIWGLAIVAAIVVAVYIEMVINNHINPKPFDHSDCQYPNRKSNPVDGCDNSDPANPACMKGGYETCEAGL